MNILVTGGAGYIGSHVVRRLCAQGHDVVAYDDLSAGHAWAVPDGKLVRGDLADAAALASLFNGHAFDAVMHFASRIVVPESVSDPLGYYHNNTGNTLTLLRHCVRQRVGAFVFSSSAAVYGEPRAVPISEDAPLQPNNPYGASKMMSERMLMDAARAGGPRVVSLRYFNAAGAAPDGSLGEAHDPETHLIPLALRVASGRDPSLTLYGTDFPTPDGTAIRDYIHVDDLAHAHVAALDYLRDGGDSVALNCGYGRGYSVREVIEAVRRVTGHAVPVVEAARRPGDCAELVASTERIRDVLDWQPQFDDLDRIVADAWRWEQRENGDVAPSL